MRRLIKIKYLASLLIGNLNEKIGFMYRSYKYVSKRHKFTIYRSIIELYLVHSPTILFTVNNAQMRRFQIQQNKIMRFILNKGLPK